jgi:hypothetical protein
MGPRSRTSTYVGLAALLACSAHLTACSSSKGDDSPSAKSSSKPYSNPGVAPEYFECDSLLTAKEIAKVVDGRVEQVASAFESPNGVAEPCAYLHTSIPEGDAGIIHEAWSFDIDCRDDALKDAKTMMTQWAEGAGDGGSYRVEVGRGGLDHGGGGIVFIDDDSPCHVRVIGPRSDTRLAIAKVLAKRLTPDTAPMKDVRSPDAPN